MKERRRGGKQFRLVKTGEVNQINAFDFDYL